MILRQAQLTWSSPTLGLTGTLVAIVALTIGCGRGDTGGDEVVSPPPPTTVEPATEAGNVDPPGGIELPAGEIPPPAPAEPNPGAEGGIELPSDSGGTSDSAGNGDSAGNDDSAARSPRIQYASWPEIEQTARSTGKVTVVDLWSLSCEPCLKEFPGMVKLHDQLSPTVACIAVNLDYIGRRQQPPESYADRVGGFLTSVGGSEFSTFISNTPSDDVFSALQIGSLPAVIVYRADGSLARLFDDAGDTLGFTYDKDVVPLVNQLVQK